MFIQLRNPINLHYYLFSYFLVNKINFIVVKRENASKMYYFVKFGYRYGYPDCILFLLSIKNLLGLIMGIRICPVSSDDRSSLWTN